MCIFSLLGPYIPFDSKVAHTHTESYIFADGDAVLEKNKHRFSVSSHEDVSIGMVL